MRALVADRTLKSSHEPSGDGPRPGAVTGRLGEPATPRPTTCAPTPSSDPDPKPGVTSNEDDGGA
ncbi:hypothetical protein ACSNOK_10795 [Streptomyces sp. URMC 126]|uniref:hypothetical protein n=1 Tax=Streptomyces sp. URMC 126 TaxID=3423401 RepID=UPI003F19A72B